MELPLSRQKLPSPKQSEAAFLKRLGGTPDSLTARQGIEAMLSFYAEERFRCVPLDEEGDMLLFQWGIYDFSQPETFQIDITRQFFVPRDDEPFQLSLTFHYDPSAAPADNPEGNRWCSTPDELPAFRGFIASVPAFQGLADAKPLRVELDFQYVG